MSKTVAQNQQNVSVRIRMLTDADGTPATGITAATAGHVISYQRGEATAFVTDGGSAADLALITSIHSDWGLFEIGEGYYRVDYPDASFLEGVGSVLCTMVTTAASSIATIVDIEPQFRFQGLASSVTATTTTFPAGTTPYKGNAIYIPAGTGIGQTRLIKSVSGEIATHDAWDINISATLSTVLLIAGDPLSATASINADVASSTLSTVSDADILLQTTNSINAAFSFTSGKVQSDLRKVAGGPDITAAGTGGQLYGE